MFTGFNEAAAYHCGKHGHGDGTWEVPKCFNEAAAYHCGKPSRMHPMTHRAWCFNEAAAYHCGKLGPYDFYVLLQPALQ